MNMEYNTAREDLKLREYGRQVHRLITHIKTVEDRDKRTQYAEAIIELMKLLNPTMKESPEYAQKLWDDLYIMADFDLDVESPFPKPTHNPDQKPKRLDYPQPDSRFKHYGKNMELLIEKAVAIENPEDKEQAALHLGKMMKSFYASWNKETQEDATVIKNLKEISKGQLVIDAEKVKEGNLFESSKVYREPRFVERDGNTTRGGGDRNNRNKPNINPNSNNNNNNRKNFKRRRPQ